VKSFLSDNPDIFTALDAQVRAAVGIAKKSEEKPVQEQAQ
jgi:hypothetical protein